MNAGNESIKVRFSESEREEIEAEIDMHNGQPGQPPWTKSDFIRAAVKEFIRKRTAGRRDKYETELWSQREPGVPPL